MDRVKRSKPTPLLAANDAPPPRRLPILLRQAWFNLNQTFRRRLAHTGVTPDQYPAMRNLAEHEAKGLTQRHLARWSASDPITIGALVKRIECSGWIDRVHRYGDH